MNLSLNSLAFSKVFFFTMLEKMCFKKNPNSFCFNVLFVLCIVLPGARGPVGFNGTQGMYILSQTLRLILL